MGLGDVMVGMEVSALAGRAGADADAAFDAFYREARPWAVRLARLLVFDAALAEDLVQDAFSRLHPRFASLDSPGAFLRTSVVNACRSATRRRQRERDRLTRSYERVPDETPEARELLDAVARLPYRQRAVVVLRYYADFSERDIADALGCRPGTVKSLASRALDTLRQELPS